MLINCNELEIVIRRISTYISHYNEFNINEDYYWDVSEDLKYVLEKRPVDLQVGSLHDDLVEIMKLLNSDRIVTPVDLNRLSAILSKISQLITKDKL